MNNAQEIGKATVGFLSHLKSRKIVCINGIHAYE